MKRKDWLQNKPRPSGIDQGPYGNTHMNEYMADTHIGTSQAQALAAHDNFTRAFRDVQREMIINGEAFAYNGDIIRNE